ncbi:MAG: hypothetical protein JWL59_154 [Chthoniobacteraceae bacterium]|nr:hypothetical protein [Chthoniobacteraceae bacterium]
MSKAPGIYTKLTAIGLGSLGFARLWSGPDHLLEVTAYGFSERYRRFYWREIEAVLVRRTAVRLIWNLIGGAFAAISLGGLAVSLHYSARSTSGPEEVLLGISIGLCGLIAAVSLIVLLVNTLLGPRCVCLLRLPVGVERLAAPTRMRVAIRMLEKIAPRIELAQTELVAAPLP